jgi:hypothetical protein
MQQSLLKFHHSISYKSPQWRGGFNIKRCLENFSIVHLELAHSKRWYAKNEDRDWPRDQRGSAYYGKQRGPLWK